MTSHKPTPRMVMAAALDLDGVLLDGMPYHYEAFNAALSTFGVQATSYEIGLFEGMRTRELIKELANLHDVFPSDEELDKAEHLKRELYSKIFKPNLMPGAQELVELLYSRGCRLAIVTGTAEASAHATVRALHAERLFEVIISHDSGVPLKPHPAPFATAAARMAVAPGHCLAIENAPPGVASATAAGLRCLAIASYVNKADLPGAEIVFESLLDLNSWLAARYDKDSNGRWVL